MRLTPAEQTDIAAAAAIALPAGSTVSLFGSRLDDARRGGDIDLLIELPGRPPAGDMVRWRNQFTAQLYRRWGERRIDMLLSLRDAPDERPIVAAARRDGVRVASP